MARIGVGPEGTTASAAALDPYIRLMAGVLIQACIDARRGDLIDKVDAILWLAGPEAASIGELVGIPNVFEAWMAGKIKIPAKMVRNGGWRVRERKFSKTAGYT